MNFSFKSIVVEPEPGSKIEAVAADAESLATRSGCPVAFEFNGVPLFCAPGDKFAASSCVSQFNRALQAQRLCGQ